MSARRDRRDKIASRAVQVGFVVALIALWYLGTAYWGISRILLPNPVNVWSELKDVLGLGRVPARPAGDADRARDRLRHLLHRPASRSAI